MTLRFASYLLIAQISIAAYMGAAAGTKERELAHARQLLFTPLAQLTLIECKKG